MKYIRPYKKLEVYTVGKEQVLHVYELLKKFPKEEQFALSDQLRRAVISVPSNIAEGSGRHSSKEQVHFLEIAYGSLREVECQLDIACELGYMTTKELETVIEKADQLGAMIMGLRKRHLENQ